MPAPDEARTAPADRTGRHQVGRWVSAYLLLGVLALLFAVFSLLRPDTFPTAFNLQSIGSTRSVVALLALAVMVPIATNEFDLSVGYVVGLTHILAIGFQSRSGLSWQLSVLLVLLLGAGIGLLNGLLVTRAQISSFIATLGVGTAIYGCSLWYTGGQQVVSSTPLPAGFLALTGTWYGIPRPVLVVLAVSVLLWVAGEYLPVGRRIYVTGANRRAAELTGIPVQRYVVGAFVVSGLLSAGAGVLLASQLRLGQSGIGAEMLLPAFAGALLGATAVRPGRVNVWGTITAVSVLAVGVSGLQQLGAAFYVDPLFNGGMLVLAVGLAAYASRRTAAGRSHRLRDGQPPRADVAAPEAGTATSPGEPHPELIRSRGED
jgi:ribose transport system permease protein